MTSPPRAPDVPGYAILGLLGTGGLGAVWRARNSAGAIVALKVVEPLRPVDAATADRIFRREALAGLNLDHPGIVRVLDALKARDGRPCIVFELAEGPTLRDAVRARGALPADEVLAVARAAASALDHAHRHGVVHGDVSPGNVLLAEGGARLLDFGLVAELEAEPGGSVWATQGFTAPEVLAGGAPTAASDLYALGRTLAFANPAGSAGLRAVLERLCRKDPAERYRSAAELGLDLDALRAGEAPLGAALAGAKARMAARRKGPWILAGIVVVAVAGLLLIRDEAPAPAPPPPRPPAAAPPPDPLAGKVEALRVLLGRDPVDFGAARSLAAEIRGAGRADPVLGELDARWRAAAKALAAAKEADAKAALASGDRAAWRRNLLEWPAEFADAPEAAAARAEVERLDEAARRVAAMVDRHLADIEAGLAALDPSAPAAAADLARMDADLARFQEDPVVPPEQRRRAGELRAKAGAAIAAREKSAREAALEAAVEAFLQAAAKPEPMVQVRARLFDAIAAAEGSPLKADLEEIRFGAEKAQIELERVLQRVVGKPWVGVWDEKLQVGVLTRPPEPREIFRGDLARFDVPALVTDREWAAAWLLMGGWMNAAGAVAEKNAVHRILGVHGNAEFPFRKDGTYRIDIYFEGRCQGHDQKKFAGPPPKDVPAKARAIEAFVGDDLLGAWEAVQEALRADPGDAESRVLAARVLLGLAKPLPTILIRGLALKHAVDAMATDPTLDAAPALASEIVVALYEDVRPRYPMFLQHLHNWMKERIARGRASPGDYVVLAERFLKGGDREGARWMLKRAQELGAAMPRWALEVLE